MGPLTYTMIPLYIFSVVCCCMLHTQAMTVSQCGKYLVAGGFDCKVRVFLAHSLERNYVYEAFTSSIRSLHFSHDQRWVRKSFGRLALHLPPPPLSLLSLPPPSLSYLYSHRYIFAGLSSGSVAVLATHYWLDL